MRKLVYLVLILSLILSCTQKEEKVEKFMENGVEVVVNHLEPYQIKGEPSTLLLEKEFTIDTERDILADLGLTEIGPFDIDSGGNIYLVNPRGTEDLIFKFDRNGNYVDSFGHRGQGPGELQRPGYLYINYRDEITITDSGNRRFYVFMNNGDLIDYIQLDFNAVAIIPLDSGNYLIWKRLIEPHGEYLVQLVLSIYNPGFEEMKELDRQGLLNPMVTNRARGTYVAFPFDISEEKIFSGTDEKGYEIYVYNLDGSLIRRIKKDYKEVPISEEYKKERIKDYPEHLKKITFFPDFFPPFQSLFTDDRGRLFVMTYEEGEIPGEYMFDIFNPKGVFIGRKSLGIFFRVDPLWAKIKQDHFYFINEKESGFMELVKNKMIWEK